MEFFGSVAFHSAPLSARRQHSDGGKVSKGLRLIFDTIHSRWTMARWACGFQTAGASKLLLSSTATKIRHQNIPLPYPGPGSFGDGSFTLALHIDDNRASIRGIL